jgi:hypothetical protein
MRDLVKTKGIAELMKLASMVTGTNMLQGNSFKELGHDTANSPSTKEKKLSPALKSQPSTGQRR